MNNSKAFIGYSNDMDGPYKNIEEYSPNKKCKILSISGNMIADILSNKNLNLIGIELFIKGRKLNFSLVFITILICCAKNCETEFYTLFYHINSK